MTAACVIPLVIAAGCGKTSQTDLAGALAAAATDGGTTRTQLAPAVPSLAYGAPHYPFGALNTSLGCSTSNGCSDGNPDNLGDPDNTTAYLTPTFNFYQNLPVSLVPSNVGAAITGCSINPALPAGLILSGADCSISGTPTGTTPPAFYTITATSDAGPSSALISFAVNASTVKAINVPAAAYVFVKNHAIAPVVPQMSGGAAAGDCTKNALPPGLSYAAGTCNITGTPTTAGLRSYIFAVTAGTTVHANFAVPPPPGYWQPLGTSVVFPILVVDPATQPVISYGTQYFGRTELKLGVTMYPVTPTNQGASITSCSIIPALPAGLSLSQSDCTISGTPSAVLSPTTFLITPMHGATAGNWVSLDLSVGPAKTTALACQSGTLCVHNQMPLWSQSDSGLANYLSAQGYNVGTPPTDQGWCGGVSSSMLLQTYFREISQYSNIQTTSWPAPFAASDTEYPFTLKSMQLVSTDIVHGGTGMPNPGMEALMGRCGMLYDWFGGGAPSIFTDPTQYAHGMPLGWMGVHGVGKADGHALAINGVEGGFFKIYDPWGAVYNATITYAADGTSGRLNFVSGNTFNDISTNDGGVAVIFPLQWIKDYVSVSGAPATYRCQ